MKAIAKVEFRSRPYRSSYKSLVETLRVEAADETHLRLAASTTAQAQIGQTKCQLVPAKVGNPRSLFYDSDSGQSFQGSYEGSDTDVVLFRVHSVVVLNVEVVSEEVVDGPKTTQTDQAHAGHQQTNGLDV